MTNDALPPPVADRAPPRGSLRTLLGYARPHRRVLIVSLVLTLLSSAAGLAQPKVAQAVIDALAIDGDLTSPLVILTGLVVVSAAIAGLNSWLISRTGERVVRAVRRGLIFRLFRLRVPELDRRSPGDLVTRVTSDSSMLQVAATNGMLQLISGAVTLIGSLVLMSTLHVGLLGVTIAILGLVAVVVLVVLPKIKAAVAKAQESVGAIGAALERTLGAARTVKANGAEPRETETANAAAESAYQAGLVGAKYEAVITVIMSLAIELTFLGVLGVGGALVAAGELGVSALIAFLLYLFWLSGPVVELASGATMLQQGLGALGRIEEVNDLDIEEDVDVVPPVPSATAPRIDIRDVTFAYVDRPPALLDVSFTAPAGGQTAIVGLSGACKTTLFGLLQRFYEPAEGAILLDGEDISVLPRAEVRRRIAYVEQDAPALAGTIRENLLYAATDATDEAIAEVLAATRLDSLIDRLPDGLDTGVGTRGVTLSGGERQRLAIARALLRRPQVLLLDEATAQLDARNEQALRDTVAGAARQCTVLLIAHRLSTVVDVDRIVVLEHGRVRAVGTHASLLTDDALYRELATTQLLAGDPSPV